MYLRLSVNLSTSLRNDTVRCSCFNAWSLCWMLETCRSEGLCEKMVACSQRSTVNLHDGRTLFNDRLCVGSATLCACKCPCTPSPSCAYNVCFCATLVLHASLLTWNEGSCFSGSELLSFPLCPIMPPLLSPLPSLLPFSSLCRPHHCHYLIVIVLIVDNHCRQ